MNTCPHCNATPCLSIWRKMYLGPTETARCRACGYRVGLDVRKTTLTMGLFFLLLVMIPIVLVLIAGFDSLPDPVIIPVLTVALLVVSMTIMLSLFAFWVPLRKDELTTAQMVEEGRARIATRQQSREVK